MGALTALRQQIAAGHVALHAKSADTSGDPLGAATLDGDFGWRNLSTNRHGQYYVGSELDWAREAGELWRNPAIALCLAFLFRKIAEPKLMVSELDTTTDTWTDFPDHPALELLKNPNSEYSGLQLRRAFHLSFTLAGEAFIYKQRDYAGIGTPRALWYLPHWQMEPIAPDGGPTQFWKQITAQGTRFYAAEDIIHATFAIDPMNHRRGYSVFRALFREVVSDAEIASYTASVLRNLGMMGALVSPANKDDTFDSTQQRQLKQLLQAQATGDNRGNVLVPNVPIKVDHTSRSPQEMAIAEMGDRPEYRICAGFGFDPMAVHLSSGTGNAKYANMKEARAAAWEDGILPGCTAESEAYTDELLYPDFGEEAPMCVRYDTDRVRDLQPDLNDTQTRHRNNWKAGGATLDEYRRAIDLPPDKSGRGKKYFFDLMPPKANAAAQAAPPDDPTALPPGDDANDPAHETGDQS